MNDKKFYNILLGLFTTFNFCLIALFCFLFIGLSRVDAKSYTWSAPSLHRICIGDLVGSQSGSCTTNNHNNIVNAINTQKGNYLQVAYNVTKSNNSSETSFTAGSYSIAFSGYFYSTLSYPASNYKIKLIYYPDSSNQYNIATCDNGEIFRITSTGVNYTDGRGNEYYYTYSCRTLNITSGKTYIGYEVYMPTSITTGNIIRYNKIENNLLIGGPSDTQDIINNFNKNFDDLINNQNQNTEDIINNQNQNTDKITDAIEKSEKTNKGILDVITNFFGNFFSNLVGIFIPSDFDFLTGFLDTLESKLGFIASVPIQFLEFLANLVTLNFDTVTSVTLPNFEILGYTFIQEQEIDLSEIMAVFQPYRIYTNIACVCFCIRYLMKLYENFANKE